jgi:hypothetical protein
LAGASRSGTTALTTNLRPRLPCGARVAVHAPFFNEFFVHTRADGVTVRRRLAERGRALRESIALALQQQPALRKDEAELARAILSLPPLGVMLCAAALEEAGEWVRLDALPAADALAAEECAGAPGGGQSAASESPTRRSWADFDQETSFASAAAGGADGEGDGSGVEACEDTLRGRGEPPAGASTY